MFRAYRATQLYQDHIPLDIIARLLGHEKLDTTRLYAKPSQESLSEAINSINPPTALNKVKLWKSKEDELAKKWGLR